MPVETVICQGFEGSKKQTANKKSHSFDQACVFLNEVLMNCWDIRLHCMSSISPNLQQQLNDPKKNKCHKIISSYLQATFGHHPEQKYPRAVFLEKTYNPKV